MSELAKGQKMGYMKADDRFALPDNPERLTDDQRTRTGGPYYISMLKSDNVYDNRQQLKC